MYYYIVVKVYTSFMNFDKIRNENIVFFDGVEYDVWDEHTVGIGGSETWILELSKQFYSMGYDVFIVTNTHTHVLEGTNVLFLSRKDFSLFFKNRKIDNLLISRKYDKDFLSTFDVNRKFVIFHDLAQYGMSFESSDEVNALVFVSKFQMDELCEQNESQPIKWDNSLLKIHDRFVIGNAVSSELYSDIPQKKNMCVWSSAMFRGIDDMISIFRIIRNAVPDFELHVCRPQYDGTYYQNQYSDELMYTLQNTEGIVFHDSLSKKDLSQLQLQSKVWIYKSHFKETFCITCLENIFADAVPIVTRNDGMNEYLKGFPLLYQFDNEYISNETVANDTIKVLTDEDYRRSLVDKLQHIKQNNTWHDVAVKWVKLFNYYK